MLFSWSEVFDGFQHAPVFGGSPHGDTQAALASREPRTVADDHPCGDQFAVKPVGIGGLHQQEVGLRRVDPLDAAASGERRRQPSAFFADLRDLRRNVPAQTLGRGLLGERIDIVGILDLPEQRGDPLPSELAKLLDLEVEAIKRQGARPKNEKEAEALGKLSVEIVGKEHDMNYKKVMRYIRLNSLVPELLDKVDTKQMGFMPAVEISYILSLIHI